MGTHIIYTAAVHNNKMGTVSLNICILFGDTFTFIKDLFLVGNIKNDLVKYFMQHIRNGLIIALINS